MVSNIDFTAARLSSPVCSVPSAVKGAGAPFGPSVGLTLTAYGAAAEGH